MAIIASAEIHRIFRADLKGPLGEVGFRLWPRSRRPVFVRADAGRFRVVDFGTNRRAYPDNEYGRVYECGLFTYREPLVVDEGSIDSEQSAQELFDEADWAECLRVRGKVRAETWPVWRRIVDFGERILEPASERWSAYVQITDERHAHLWAEFYARRLPAIVDRYRAKHPVPLTSGTQD